MVFSYHKCNICNCVEESREKLKITFFLKTTTVTNGLRLNLYTFIISWFLFFKKKIPVIY